MNQILFSYEHGDLQAYPNVDSLVSKLEKTDVANGEYLFWDETMREFALDVSRWPHLWQKPSPDILIAPSERLGEDRILQIMLDYCSRFGLREGDGQSNTLSQAILAFQQQK